jgi:hypothetical protein
MNRKPRTSLTAQLIADRLLRQDPFNLAVLLGRPTVEKLVDFVINLHDQVRSDLDRQSARGLAPSTYDPKLKRPRKLTDEELDNA